MKEIIQPGRKQVLRTIKRFECTKCHCVFECDKDEYMGESQYNEYYRYSYCPECGSQALEVIMRM